MSQSERVKKIAGHIEAIFQSQGWIEALKCNDNLTEWLGPRLHAIADLSKDTHA